MIWYVKLQLLDNEKNKKYLIVFTSSGNCKPWNEFTLSWKNCSKWLVYKWWLCAYNSFWSTCSTSELHVSFYVSNLYWFPFNVLESVFSNHNNRSFWLIRKYTIYIFLLVVCIKLHFHSNVYKLFFLLLLFFCFVFTVN